MHELNVLDVTPDAAKAFRDKLEKRSTPSAMIRFGVKGGACSGFSYQIQFDDGSVRDTDSFWEVDGVRFVIDKKSQLLLSGTRVTWKQTLMHQGFDFENPKETSRCGCGGSFSTK